MNLPATTSREAGAKSNPFWEKITRVYASFLINGKEFFIYFSFLL